MQGENKSKYSILQPLFLLGNRIKSSFPYVIYLLKKNPLSIAGGIMILFLILVAIFGPMLTVYDPIQPNILMRSKQPSTTHWMGTDIMGMDIFTRIIHATRIDLKIAFAGVLGAIAVGTVFGLVTGFYGKWLDEIMMRFLDSMQAFPMIILGMTIAAILGPSIRNLVIVLVIVNFPLYARLTRSLVLTVKETQYVDAAKIVGNSNFRIIFRHILPNCMGPLYVQGSLNLGWSVLMAATLSFIGLGVPAPTPEWGLMIREGAGQMILGRWWMAFFPGVFIFFFVLSANLLGDGLQDIFDPRRK